MASIDDILKRGGASRATQGTDITASPNRAGAGANAQAIPALIRDTREYNAQKEIEKVDHNNPLLTTANLENSNPLISIPTNTLNLGGRILSNMGQGAANAEAMYHEVRASTIEGTLPQEVFDMQSKIDLAEGEIAALNAKLTSGKTGSLQEHMKLIGEISSKSAELSKQKIAVEETGYGDSIRELKEQRKTSQFKADRSKNGMDTVFNTKQRDEVQQKIQSEVDSWKLANPEASALDQIKASSKIAAKHYTDNPLEIGNMAVESAAALISTPTLVASAASQGANFYVNQTKKYNEAEGRTATGLVSGKEHAALAAGTAAYTALNFYADRVMQKAIFPSANSAFQRAETAALEAAAKGATEAAAMRTAANALRPTVKGTVARGVFAAGQEYPVEAVSSMMEDQWGHGRHTGDWTPFGVGGTAGLLAGGAMTAPSTLAGIGGATAGNVAASQADAATNPENKKYNPTTDMAQAYGDVLNSPNATPEQITAARTKAKDILGSTQSRLSEMTQIQEAVASGDVGNYFASTLEKDIDNINSQIASGKLTDAEAIAKVDELEAGYELLAEKASEYVGKSKKLDSEVNKLRKDLVASTKYHSKMSENINLAPDTIQSIKERQAIIESTTASLEDLERATQDIIAYPMVATVSQLQKAMSLPNLTPEAYESLRVLTDFQIKHKGESLSKVRRHITEGSTGYRGLPEYMQGLTQALIDGDTNSVNGLMYDIGAFAQSHEKKAEAMADVIQNVPAGSKWQIARDKQNQWYVITDETKFLTGDKASGAYTIHKGSTKLLEAILQEVQMIKDTQAAMQAAMDLREQMQVEPADMSTYNRIKYAGQLPLTHATTMEEVAKFEAMLDQSNQVIAYDAEGNPHNVTVNALHPHDASKVMVTIEGESKKFATTRDRLAVLDGTGNLLYDVRKQEDTPQPTPTPEAEVQEEVQDEVIEPTETEVISEDPTEPTSETPIQDEVSSEPETQEETAVEEVTPIATEGEVEVEAQSNEESDSDPRADVADTETELTTLNIWAGTDENTVLSNLASRPFVYEFTSLDGSTSKLVFRSVEHGYQVLKSGRVDEVTHERYEQNDAHGKKIVGKLPARTQDNYNIELMEKLVLTSFSSSSKNSKAAREALLATGDAVLTHTQDRGIWKTEFPRILMKVREELKEDVTETSTIASQDETTDTGDTNVPPQVETPVEEQTEASETTPQYPRTVSAEFEVDGLDEAVKGEITFNGDGTATVTVGKKTLSIEVTPENEKSFKQLGKAINLADPSIELSNAQLLSAEEQAKIRAEIYGEDAAKVGVEDDPTEEINSRTDSGLDEVNVENAEGLLDAFKDESSDLGKRFKQVGSQAFAKPFIAVKDFFTSLDWNAPRIFDYLKQFLATATNSITEDDVDTMHALRNFHQGMKGNNFSQLIKAQVSTMLKVTDPKLLTTEHNLFSQMISYDSEGNPVIEENVLGAMSVAAYDYILKNADFHVNSDKGVNFMLGVTSEQFIRGEDSKKYRRLTTRREKLIQELGDSAVRALGIKTKKGFTEDEALKLGASMGAVIYHAMKQRYLNEKFYYRHSILADVQKHMGYSTAKRMYEDWMEQKYDKGEYLPYPKYLKALRQFNRILTNPNSGLQYKDGNGSIPLHKFIQRVQSGTNDKMIPSIVEANLMGNAQARTALLGLYAELHNARTEMNTPTFFAGIVQDEKAITENEDPRNQARRREQGLKKRDEQAGVVKAAIRGVPKRSDTLHKVFGLDRGKIDPLTAPVPFRQQDIKKSKGKVSTEQARILNKIQQEPLIVKSFTRSVSWLNKNYTDMLHDLIGAKPALDTLYVDKRANTEAAARNLIKELDQAVEYVDIITNEDGTWNKFYHELVVWSNNRFGYASNVFNLQTSKIARSMSTYENNVATLTKTVDGTSVNDIFGSDGNLTEYGKLIHGVAIYAEKSTSKKNVIYDEDYMGDTTVDKAPNEVLLPELHKRLYENFKPHFDAIRKMNAQEELTDSDQRLIVELVGEMGSGIQSLEAAVELAAFWDTKKGETFQSHLTVESDGITNGMIINQIQNGSATIDMLVEGGLLTKNEMSDNPNASFFTLKRDGRNGEALQDYYTRAGTRQKEAWELIKSKLNLGSFDITMTDEQNLVQAIAYIDKTFGERKGAKAFATPDNYAAGLDRIKEIVADHFVDNLFGAVEDFGKVGDNEGLAKLLEATNTIIRFHNKYLSEIDGLESKWNAQKKRFEVQYSGTEKVSSLLKRAMMTATSQHAAQDKYVTDAEGKLRAEHIIFDDSAAFSDIVGYGKAVTDLANLYSIEVARQLGLKKEDKLPSYTDLLLTDGKTPEQIKADQVQYRKHMNTYLLNVLHAQASQFRSRQVPEVDINNLLYLAGSAQAAVNYRIWDDAQLNALRNVSNVTQGTATVFTLKRMNAQFYQVRDANIKMMRVAYNVYQTIWDTVARQILDRRIRKTGVPTDELNNETPLTSLLTIEDVKELERTMEKFLPTGTTAFSRKSKNSNTSGAVFLDKVAKLFTEAVHTQNVRFDPKNKTIDNYLTGVYKEVEQSIGLKGNSTMTQSVDAYVSTNALDKILGGNFHDSNGFNIGNYQEGAQAQNTAFFDAMVEHSAQEGFADAVLIPLKAFLEDGTVIKSKDTIEKVLDAARKLGREDVSDLLTVMLQAETKKLALLTHVERVQQYGTEDGHVDVTPEQKAKIAESVRRIEEGETSLHELTTLINTSPSKVKVITPKNPLPSYATALHPNTVDQANADAADTEDANAGNPFVQSLLAQGTENLEVADVVKTVEDYLDANPSEMSKYYKLVLSMLPDAVKSGTKVNIFNPHAIPAHVKGEKVLQMERHTQGWYTEDQINLVYSAYAALTPETFVHEMIHAALANFIRTELRKAKKESKDGKPNWEAVHPAVRDLQNIRSQVQAAVKADPNLADIAEDYAVALRDIQEFVTYGMTNERFINALKGIYITQTAQHKDKSQFSLIGSLKSAFTAFIESATEMLLGKTAKFKGKGKDAKINALAALVTNVSANLQAASEASTDMGFDEILQHVHANAQGTQQKIREMKPKEIFEKLHQGNLSTEFQNHLRTDVLPLISEISESIGSTEVGRMFNEQVDPQTIWDDAVINGKVPYASDLFSMGFPMSDQEAYAVESLEASLNAIIDYSYGSTVHREMDRMFVMARNKLKPRDFHDGDWKTASVNEKMVAREKWNKLFNLAENLDNEGRNRFLTRFMALTLGSEKFNKLLNKVDPVPEELEGASTVYEYVLNRFHRFIDWIAERAARTGNEPKIQGRIHILAHQLAEIDAKRKNHLMNQSSKNPFMNVDSIGNDAMDKVRLAIRSLVEAEMFRKSPLTPVKAASEFGSLLLKQNLEELPDQIMQLRANLHPNTLPGAIAEIQQEMGRPVGIRKKIMAMISLNSKVQKERETMRQHIQREVTQMFDERGEYLQPEDWKALTNVILRSGLSRLYFEEYEPNVIYDLIRDKEARQQEIASIESELRQDIDGGIKIHRTKQLARYMAIGKAHILQAQNTLQISAGVGLKDNVQVPSWFDPEVKLLNRLVSLYNLNYQDQAEIQRVSKVLDREASRLDNGVEHLLRFHQKLSADSAMQFADNPLSQSQSYTPEIHNTNRDIQFVANKAEEQLYERLGYKELDGSELSKAFYDVAKTKVKIMVNMHADNQRIVDGGLMLNTTDAKGTDIGVEDIEATTKQLARKLIRESRNLDYDPSTDTETHGVPKLNAEGKVTGMRYTMLNKTRDDLLERNNHPADLMAEYAASNLDLMNVEKVNQPVLEALHQDYLDNYTARPQDFVELSSMSEDPELVRMYRMIPYKSREYLKSLFGDDPIMVNANVMTIAFGYRKYTPTDIFKKDEDERNIAEAAYAGVLNGIFGEERAATVSSHMIKGTMEIMRKVKDFYVIRNFFTLFNNILSNNAILLAYGVSPVAMARDTKVALQAGLKYKKDYSLYIQYKVKLQLGIGNMGENRQKMSYYEDSLNRNPLKEFIEAGMMSSIVEDIEQTKDDYSYQAALEKKVAGVVDTIPKPIRDGVNFVMVNQGSPLHKMLSDTTSMSDFVAKYVLYNYHTKKKGMSHAEALFESHEAFINYEVPSNKALQFLNDIGLVMFTKYYLRIQRVIYTLLRKHPASVLLQSYLLGSIAGMPTVLESFVPSTMHLPVAGSVFESFSAVGQPIPLQLVF